MKRNLFWKFLLVVFVVLWSLWEMNPPSNRDLIEQFERSAERPDGAFSNIVERARAATKENPQRAFVNLAAAIGTNDITRYFSNRFNVSDELPADRTLAILHRVQKESAGKIKLGLDLQGGTSFLVQMSTNELVEADARSAALSQAVEVLRKRVDRFGVSEPVIQPLTSLVEAMQDGLLKKMPKLIGGRYGLSSKEFTPAMVKAVLDELCNAEPKNHFTVGINDDVAHTSLDFDPSFMIEPEGVVSCVFFGLGADGTVGADKNSIKIIGEETENFAQGYFYYDSKKSGTVTMSHLRFGPTPVRAPYLVELNQANFVACHQFSFLERVDMLKYARPGATFLLNSLYGPEEVWDNLPTEVQGEGGRKWKAETKSFALRLTPDPFR